MLSTVLGAILGALLGAAVGFYLVVEVQEPPIFFGVWAGTTVLFGYLFARAGVEFWQGIRDWWL
jgi:ABC-type lipoprotein release transport system permease subunit